MAVAKNVVQFNTFRGCDFTNAGTDMDADKSPNCVNMIRDVPGKIRKRMGYEFVKKFHGNINGYHYLHNEDKACIHVGSDIYDFDTDFTTLVFDEYITEEEYNFGCEVRIIVSMEKTGDIGDGTVTITFTDGTVKSIEPSVQRMPQYEDKYAIVFEIDNNPHIKKIEQPYYVTEGAEIIRWHSVTDNSRAGGTCAKTDTALYRGANDVRSISIPFDNKLYIIDGKALLEYDGYKIKRVKDSAYIPTVTISKSPDGGGTDYEPLNLMTSGFTEQFYVEQGKTASCFYLSFSGLDQDSINKPVQVFVKNSNGEWVEKQEDVDFSVDYNSGIIRFSSPVGESPVSGEDNVKITAYRTVEGYAERIDKCQVGCLFGVGGAQDRIFLGGNPDSKFLNYDWFSQQNNPTYFPDTSYCTVGNTSSSIVGYATLNNHLVTFKGEGELHQNIVIRSGNLVDSQPAFALADTLQGEPAIAPNTFQYLATEPIFLTKSGIKAITSQDISAEKYSQDRSFYINGKLLKENEEDLRDACSVVYDNMYLLSVGSNLYVLDGIQPMQTDKSLPYATRQYASFFCDNIPARSMWVDKNNRLFFGTSEGKVYRFYNDVNEPESYNDDGQAIQAIYETPDLWGKVFFKNKTFKFLAVRMGVAIYTSIAIWAQRNGLWNLIKEDFTSANYFRFDKINFSRFTFNTDNTQKTVTAKLRVKKVDKTRIRLVNDSLNEPFSIYDIGLEYTENGNRRR